MANGSVIFRSMQSLSREDRLSLMRFVCSFAWADFEVQDQERTFIGSKDVNVKLVFT